MSLPDWLLRKLEAENPDGVTRGARLTRCDTCRAHVLRGLDADRCALATTCTPIALDHLGEYLALTKGLRTYTLARRANTSGNARWEIDPRAQWQIANPHRRYPVIPEHCCGIHLPASSNSPFQRLAPAPTHDHPPF
jgi:hypothetical protein